MKNVNDVEIKVGEKCEIRDVESHDVFRGIIVDVSNVDINRVSAICYDVNQNVVFGCNIDIDELLVRGDKSKYDYDTGWDDGILSYVYDNKYYKNKSIVEFFDF